MQVDRYSGTKQNQESARLEKTESGGNGVLMWKLVPERLKYGNDESGRI